MGSLVLASLEAHLDWIDWPGNDRSRDRPFARATADAYATNN